MYSLQVNAHGNRIVCRGTSQRPSYRIVFTGSYRECQDHPITRTAGTNSYGDPGEDSADRWCESHN